MAFMAPFGLHPQEVFPTPQQRHSRRGGLALGVLYDEAVEDGCQHKLWL